MAVSLDLALGPASLFSKFKTTVISELLQKPADVFITIPAKSYVNVLLKAIDDSRIPAIYKKYLSELVMFEAGKKTNLSESFSTKDINFNEVQKYFGEVLGPINIIKSRRGIDQIVFPTRTNYQLFDFFVRENGLYVGFSSKAGGQTSNTLTPTVINERIKRSKKSYRDKEILFGKEVFSVLGESSIIDGLMKVTALLSKANKFPKNMDNRVILAMKSVDWERYASVMQNRKTSTIDKMNIKGFEKIEYFLSNYVLPRVKFDQRIKNAYISGSKKYTGNNVAYGLGMMIVDANNDGVVDASPFLRTLFNDLNLIKLTITSAVPKFSVVNLENYKDAKFKFRSKYRWDVIKDKLGIQL